MEVFWVILAVVLVGSWIVVPLVVAMLNQRVGQLEKEVRLHKAAVAQLEREEMARRRKGEKVSVAKATEMGDEPFLAEEKAESALTLAKKLSDQPADLVKPVVLMNEAASSKKEAAGDVEQKVEKLPVLPVSTEKSQKVAREGSAENGQKRSFAWSGMLAKLGMCPPKSGEGPVMAWWSTRIGVVLGVIAAVFFGMYVNQDTVPWMRWAQMLMVSVGVFLGGWWIERKLPAFGRVVAAGGLGLIYVAAYAAYGLPAMKITDSALLGALGQVGAIGLMAGWAVFRRREGVFSLSLVLGYVTSWFALREGVDPLPFVSLITLAVFGAVMYAWKGWRSGLWGSLLGSGVGLVVLAEMKGGAVASGGWLGAEVMLGSAVLLSVVYLAVLYLVRLEKEGEQVFSPELLFGAWLGVAMVLTGVLDLPWEWTYAAYAVVAAVTGYLWGSETWGFSDDKVKGRFWAKAAVLVTLCLVLWLEGPARVFALLAQVATLLAIARREKSILFEVGAVLLWLVAWGVARHDLTDTLPSLFWTIRDGYLLLFHALTVGLVLWHAILYRRDGDLNLTRPRLAGRGFILGAVALEFVIVGGFRIDWSWSILAPLLAGGVIFLLTQAFKGLRLREGWIVPFVILIGTAFQVLTEIQDAPRVWQAGLWILVTWGFVVVLARVRELIPSDGEWTTNRVLSLGFLMLSALVVYFVGEELLAEYREAMVLWCLGLALFWKALEGRAGVPDLALASLVPAATALVKVWTGEFGWTGSKVLGVAVLMAAVYALLGWWRLRGSRFSNLEDKGAWRFVISMWSRVVLFGGLVGMAFLSHAELWGYSWLTLALAGSGVLLSAMSFRMKEVAWLWLGLSFVFFSGGFAMVGSVVKLDERGFGLFVLAIIFFLTIAVGLVLSRIPLAKVGQESVLTKPKCASLAWGGWAMILLLFGFSLDSLWEQWTTAIWALGGVFLVVAGFWGNLRAYRVVGLIALGCAILRLFIVDIDDSLWRIIGFGITGALFVGIGYIYNRYHRRLADGDLDWGKKIEN